MKQCNETLAVHMLHAEMFHTVASRTSLPHACLSEESSGSAAQSHFKKLGRPKWAELSPLVSVVPHKLRILQPTYDCLHTHTLALNNPL